MTKKKIVKNLERHKLLLKKISDNIGKGMTFEEAMLDLGYSPSYAKSSHLKSTNGWQQLLEETLPNDLLLKKHTELLNKEELVIKHNTNTKQIEIVKTGQPHSDVKLALDMGYKLRDKYTPEKYNVKFAGYSKEQLIELIMNKFRTRK